MNKVILIGRIGMDPKSFTFDNDMMKTTFSLATSERFGEKVTTTWHNIITWKGLAKVAADYLKKGSLVSIEGRIVYREYEKDDVKHFVTEIVAEKLQMLDKAPKSEKTEEPISPVAETSAPQDDLPF